MCEVQIMRKFNRKKNSSLDKGEVKAFLTMLSEGSRGNPHAYGLFSDKYMFRKEGAFHEEKAQVVGGVTTNILKHEPSFLVGHNRFTTQGCQTKNFNNHPFPTADWIIVHNGTIRNDNALCKTHNLNYEEETDSAIIVNLLQKFYSEGMSAEDCIVKVAESLVGGFSICAYNKTEDRLFYFKNESTHFGFRMFQFKDGSEVLVGSTKVDKFDDMFLEDYMIFVEPLYESYYDLPEAYSCVVYEISDKEIKELAYFTPQSVTSYYNNQSKNYGKRTTYNNGVKTTHYGGIHQQDWDSFDNDWKKEAKDIEVDSGSLTEVKEMEKAIVSTRVEKAGLRISEYIEDILDVDVGMEIVLSSQEIFFDIRGSIKDLYEDCNFLIDSLGINFWVKDGMLTTSFEEAVYFKDGVKNATTQ